MGRSLDDIFDALPKKRRQRIDARFNELLAEVDSLKALRKRMSISQGEIAKVMKMSQPAVSKVENEADMLVSTLRSYAEAIGCQLDLVLRTPQGVPVRLGSFSDLVTRPKKMLQGTSGQKRAGAPSTRKRA